MDELLINIIMSLLMIAPIIGGFACLLMRKLSIIGRTVGIVAAILIVSVLLMSYQVLTEGTIVRDAEGLSDITVMITLLDFALMALFTYLAWKARSVLMGIFAGIQILVMLAIEIGGFEEMGAAIRIDELSVLMAFITSVIGSIICVYAVRYMTHYEDHGRFFAVMLLFLGAMNGAVFTNDLLWLFFFWEVTTICSYLLIGHTGTEQAKRSAVTAAVYTLGGGAALALGILLSVHYYGTVFIDQIPAGTALGGFALLPLALMAVGAFTKSAQLPFQKWLLGAMVAPTPVSALLHSATMVNLGIYLLLRIGPNLHGTGPLVGIIGLVGAITFLTTAALAIAQSNAKRVLAYSTISNLGLIVACVGLDTSLALTAGMLLLLFHAISKALLFMSVGVIKERIGSEDIDDMEGLRDRMPIVSMAVLAGVSMMVLPPFGMFASKWLLSESLTSFPILAILLVLGFGATLVYYAKWLGRVFAGGTERTGIRRDGTDRTYVFALASTIAIGILATMLIGPVLDVLINPYISTVFDPRLTFGPWGLTSSMGLFPIVGLLVVASIIVLAVAVSKRMPPVADIYACGESADLRTGTFYYWSETRTSEVTLMANTGMSAMMVLLILIPVILGVAA